MAPKNDPDTLINTQRQSRSFSISQKHKDCRLCAKPFRRMGSFRIRIVGYIYCLPKPPMKHRILALCFCALPVLSWSQSNFDTVKIRPFQLADKLYMLTGSGG